MADYELQRVPHSARRSFWAVTSVWVGYVFLLASMMAGAGLAAGLPLKTVIIVTLVANCFLSLIAGVMSVISFQTGYTFAVTSRFSFGLHGSKLPSIIYALIQVGWYTIQSAIYGHLLAIAFELGPVGEGLAMMGSALVMGAFAIRGFKALEVLSLVAIPAMIFLCIATAMRAVQEVGGWAALFAAQPDQPMALFSAISIVIGTWVFGASTTIADFNRFARSRRDAFKGAVVGLLVVNSFVVLCGAVAGASAGDYDMVNILMGMGLVVPAFVLLTTNLWTTNGANLYSVGLTLANVFNLPRSRIMYAVVVLCALLTLFKPYEIGAIFGILITVGIVVPPLAGILIADYFVIHRQQYPDLDQVRFKGVNLNALIAWVTASLVAYYVDWGLTALNGLVIAFIAYSLLMKATRTAVFEEVH